MDGSGTTEVMKQSVADLGTILSIWAHPDDEVWASGALMAAAIDNGQTVVCVTATDGAAGQTADQAKWPRELLAEIRHQEMNRSMQALGIKDMEWLGYKDGQLHLADAEEAIARLVAIIDEVRPDTLVTFEPAGITGHPDHKAVCDWVCKAVRRTHCQPTILGACETKERYDDAGRDCDRLFNIYYGTVAPLCVSESEADFVFHPESKQRHRKLAALKAHRSQTEQFFNSEAGERYIDQLCAAECFKRLQPKNSHTSAAETGV